MLHLQTWIHDFIQRFCATCKKFYSLLVPDLLGQILWVYGLMKQIFQIEIRNVAFDPLTPVSFADKMFLLVGWALLWVNYVNGEPIDTLETYDEVSFCASGGNCVPPSSCAPWYLSTLYDPKAACNLAPGTPGVCCPARRRTCKYFSFWNLEIIKIILQTQSEDYCSVRPILLDPNHHLILTRTLSIMQLLSGWMRLPGWGILSRSLQEEKCLWQKGRQHSIISHSSNPSL